MLGDVIAQPSSVSPIMMSFPAVLPFCMWLPHYRITKGLERLVQEIPVSRADEQVIVQTEYVTFGTVCSSTDEGSYTAYIEVPKGNIHEPLNLTVEQGRRTDEHSG